MIGGGGFSLLAKLNRNLMNFIIHLNIFG